VTFLFTDIEGSTRRWESDAAAMRSALAAHDEVLRGVIEAHGGWLFKHTGDGVVAAFASPRSAVDAAIAAQRDLQLPVRMGMATGEATHQDGDYFGAVLNRAARVMAAGHGGQILAADSTASLVSGIDLLDLGPRRLRDVPSPVGLFQVRAPGLREEFPPLRVLDTGPGNLRPPTSTFIGRDAEVTEIKRALRAHRLVTLTGVGGVGKTRLAQEIASTLHDEFTDGVWLFELAALTDPAAVPDAVAAVLGITQQPGKILAETVAAALEGRRRLLVFDNCEHMLDAAADLLEAILGQSATVKVLATSRESLGVADEQVWRVRSLDLEAAVDLFVERAQAVLQSFSADTTDAIAEICDRLDGIPLAIELAASRMASMTAGEVRDRLDHRFRLLVGSRRGLERHQTLRQAVQWSYDLLAEPEKALLDRCSVFSGGFYLESACAVTNSEEFTTLDLLDALVRKSLLVADRSAGRTRFSMLETIRQFAEDQLVARGEADAVRTAHARHFAGLEASVMSLWDSPDQGEAYNWFAAELPNLRSAFRWAADHGDVDVAGTIAVYASFLGYMAETYEPIAWAEELIEPARATDHPRLAALYVLGSQCFMAGRPEAAVHYGEAGQAVVSLSGNNVRFGIQGWLGGGYTFTGQPERAVRWCRAELARDRDTHTLSRASLILALATAGESEAAMTEAQGLVEAAEERENPCVLSYALLACGFALRTTDPDRALDTLRRGLAIAEASGNRWTETSLAGSLCRLEAEQGDPKIAVAYFPVAIRNYHDSGNTTAIKVPLAVLANFLDRLGIYEPAAVLIGYALTPVTAGWIPRIKRTIVHLRDVLGDQAYGTLICTGEAMTIAEVVAFAYEQIDHARAALEQLP
jgi:predicted ATPase